MGSNGFAVTRRMVLLAASGLTFGCVDDDSGEKQDATEDGSDESGEEPSENKTPETENITQAGGLTLTSPAFEAGERIPEKYGYEAENVNPPLEIENVPDGTRSLALIMDDPDAVEPAGKVWDHWLIWNIPPEMTTIPEDWDPSDATEGTNDYDTVGYGGPN
ncbi:MAG: YbhB/YbcL family Raf kinase inhibitor-like protein, partial [Haloarculaceae archaeon]